MSHDQSSAEWVRFWQERIGDSPVQVTTRFEMLEVDKVDVLGAGAFSGKVHLFLTVNEEDLYSKNERSLKPGDRVATVKNDKDERVNEWFPWLEVEGRIDSNVKWVVHRKDQGTLEYNYQITGSFPLARNANGAYYPFDFHELSVNFTSNWDSRFLVFRCENDDKIAFGSNVSSVREDSLERSLRGRWNYSRQPRVVFGTEKGHGKIVRTYSNVQSNMYIGRQWLGNLFADFLRPFTLASLAAISGSIFAASSTDGLNFNIGLLIGLSVMMSSRDNHRVTFSDIYVVASFLYIAAVITIDYLRTTNDISLDTVASTSISVGLFAAYHGLFLAYYFLVIQRNKLQVMSKHRMNIFSTMCGCSSDSSSGSSAAAKSDVGAAQVQDGKV